MNSRTLLPDRHASGVSTRTTTSGSRVARSVSSFGNLPLSRDVSLLTALVGAMIVNESQAGSFSTEPVPPSELPPKDGLQVAIGDRQTRPSQFFLAGDDSDDRTVEMGTKQPYVSDELDRSGSEAFYAVDENLETPVAEFLEQLFAQEAFVPDTHESNIYEVTQTDLSNYLSMEWSGQDPATEATADTQGEQEEDSRTSLTEADFADLTLEEGELDPNQITIAESSEGSYFPAGSLAQAGGGGGGGAGGGATSSGVVVDGYLSGAKVARANGSGASVTTNPDGTFNGLAGSGAFVVTGGIDVTTGQAFSGVLRAPAGSGVVTPLTTLVQTFADRGVPESLASAQVLRSLGLPASFDLLNVDPVAAAKDGGEDSSAAFAVQKAGVQVATMLQAAGEGEEDGYEEALTALAGSIANAEAPMDLADEALLSFIGVPADLIEAVSDGLEAVEDAKNLVDVASAQSETLFQVDPDAFDIDDYIIFIDAGDQEEFSEFVYDPDDFFKYYPDDYDGYDPDDPFGPG